MHLVIHSGTSEGLVSRTLRLAPLDAFGNIQEKCRFQYSLPFLCVVAWRCSIRVRDGVCLLCAYGGRKVECGV